MVRRGFRGAGGAIKLPKQKREERGSEYGYAKKGIAVCKTCHSIQFKKEWHHPDSLIRVGKHAKGNVHLDLCPACKMVREGVFEGEIRIENVPQKYHGELVNLIVSFGRKATKRDPEDRIIEIEREGRDGFRVTTTENRLAVALSKKVKQVFKKVDVAISYSREPFEVTRTRIIFI